MVWQKKRSIENVNLNKTCINIVVWWSFWRLKKEKIDEFLILLKGKKIMYAI